MVKCAFTMIELVFVIVILGILLAVALPRLNATRDDAALSVAARNLSVLITDLAMYYTTHQGFSDDFAKMTRVVLKDNNFQISGSDCLDISTDEAFIVIAKSSPQSPICQSFLDIAHVRSLLNGRISKSDNNFTDISKSARIYIPVGSTKIIY